jgi:hypothetical protein
MYISPLFLNVSCRCLLSILLPELFLLAIHYTVFFYLYIYFLFVYHHVNRDYKNSHSILHFRVGKGYLRRFRKMHFLPPYSDLFFPFSGFEV